MMVQDNGHIQQRGAYNFLAHYETACAKQDSIPLSAVKVHLDKEMLDFNGDRMNMSDWTPILSSICINKHLHHIAISSMYYPYLGSGHSGKVIVGKDKIHKAECQHILSFYAFYVLSI